jgi:hypothetical protein
LGKHKNACQNAHKALKIVKNIRTSVDYDTNDKPMTDNINATEVMAIYNLAVSFEHL